MIITKLAFRNRFTMTEKVALYTASNSTGGIGLKVYLDDLAAATFVDLSRPDTIANVNYLATIGIITSARANEILTTPPTQTELATPSITINQHNIVAGNKVQLFGTTQWLDITRVDSNYVYYFDGAQESAIDPSLIERVI